MFVRAYVHIHLYVLACHVLVSHIWHMHKFYGIVFIDKQGERVLIVVHTVQLMMIYENILSVTNHPVHQQVILVSNCCNNGHRHKSIMTLTNTKTSSWRRGSIDSGEAKREYSVGPEQNCYNSGRSQ